MVAKIIDKKGVRKEKYMPSLKPTPTWAGCY